MLTIYLLLTKDVFPNLKLPNVHINFDISKYGTHLKFGLRAGCPYLNKYSVCVSVNYFLVH